MADGKWIDGLTPEMPLADAAWQVLDLRFRVVMDYLPKAVHEANRDPENVHQLRVGTRRADASLRLFSDCLPKKIHRQARRRLRTIRRAAGEARDWDVFLDDLRERRQRQTIAEQPGFDCLAGYALGQRTAAQSRLESVYQEEWPGFEEFLAELIEEVRSPHGHNEELSLVEHGRDLLTLRLQKLVWAVDEDLTDNAKLHQVRIEGKRLRYAMEIFADCFPAPFKEALYPQIEAMQEALGKANDSNVAAGLLTALRDRMKHVWRGEWRRLQPGVNALARFHQRRFPQERKRFHKLWEQWRLPETIALWESVVTNQSATTVSSRS